MDSPVKPGNDSIIFSSVILGLFPVIFGLVFLFVMLGFNPGIQKTQGRASRYVHRKQRASTKVRTAAIDAVKLATACYARV